MRSFERTQITLGLLISVPLVMNALSVARSADLRMPSRPAGKVKRPVRSWMNTSRSAFCAARFHQASAMNATLTLIPREISATS
jgi:hypothetical protein